jgi:hypothetical protein
MRFVDGSDLAALIESEGFLDPEASVAIVGQVASALDAAHAEGLVHRDVKPANILIEGNRRDAAGRRAFLSDFGITRRQAGPQTTEAGEFIGTIDYMAPEQITGGTVDGRTDQYSLACVLFQCLTGQVPFPRSDRVAVMYGHMQERVPQAGHRRSGLGHGSDAVIQRGMSKRPDRRFSSCSEFTEAAAKGLGVEVRAPAAGSRRSIRWASSPRRATSQTNARRRTSGSRGASSRPIRAVPAVALAVAVAAAATAFVVLTDNGPRPHVNGPVRKSFPTAILWARAPDPGGELGGPLRQVITRAAAGDSRVVAVGFQESPEGKDALAWVSSDGLQWDLKTPAGGAGPGNQEMDGVVHSGSAFVAVGRDSGNGGLAKAVVWTSRNRGDSWARDDSRGLAESGHEYLIHKVILIGGDLFAVGWDLRSADKDAALWRFNGTDWTRVPLSPEDGAQELWGITQFGTGGLVAVGSSLVGTDRDAAVWYSPDGGSWSRVSVETLHTPGTQVMKAVVPGGEGLVAVGRDGSSGSTGAAVWTSPDGIHWAARNDPAHLGGVGHREMIGIIPFHGGLIAVGEAGTPGDLDAAVWLSLDGSQWVTSASDALAGPGTQKIKSVLVFHGVLIAVGVDSASNEGDAAVWIGTPIYPGSTTDPGPTA